MENATRNRWTGYFGVAIATLLTPAGKLISSAVAAGVAVALIAANDNTGTEPSAPPPPRLETSSALIEDYFENEIATGALTSFEPQEAIDAINEKSVGLIPATMPSTIVLSNTDNASSGRGAMDTSPLAWLLAPLSILREPDIDIDCDQVLIKDVSQRTELENTVCEATIAQAEQTKEETVALIAEVEPTTGEGSNRIVVIPTSEGSNPIIPTSEGSNPPLVIATNNSPEDEPTGATPPQPRNGLSSDPIVSSSGNDAILIAAIPEPSTIGLMLLGLAGLGSIYRRKRL